ncbi:hypothetical protein DFA_06526 [Cavenderia fasciculata]|uniref:Chitin-binding type-2 domain-containing protein n=1 Tax=Cavenderia fasciculata TaxID=261658 RepID=F4PJ90_CACFS|nr:uncharacterized protein DFA_06526 [Cavenderia fasciculata]EGG24376.1 hypothetical protein DFA_06526 [Cavenderia fasciculata]|eukprot:XP_004362227.1 hypothetical protein DFA_06526 [Cavenderia fasciculata]
MNYSFKSIVLALLVAMMAVACLGDLIAMEYYYGTAQCQGGRPDSYKFPTGQCLGGQYIYTCDMDAKTLTIFSYNLTKHACSGQHTTEVLQFGECESGWEFGCVEA